jgi:hypothetical protein
VRRIILEIVFGPANKEKPEFSQRTLTTSRNLLALEVTEKSRRKAQTSGHRRKTREAVGENHQATLQASSVSRSSIFGLQKQV